MRACVQKLAQNMQLSQHPLQEQEQALAVAYTKGRRSQLLWQQLQRLTVGCCATAASACYAASVFDSRAFIGTSLTLLAVVYSRLPLALGQPSVTPASLITSTSA